MFGKAAVKTKNVNIVVLARKAYENFSICESRDKYNLSTIVDFNKLKPNINK